MYLVSDPLLPGLDDNSTADFAFPLRAGVICSLFIAFIGGLVVKPRWLVAEKMVKISIMGAFLCHNRVV